MIARIKIRVPYVTVHRNIAKELFPANFHFNRAFIGLVLWYYLKKQSITIIFIYKEHANKERQQESNCTNFISYPSVLIAYVAFGQVRLILDQEGLQKCFGRKAHFTFPPPYPLPPFPDSDHDCLLSKGLPARSIIPYA